MKKQRTWLRICAMGAVVILALLSCLYFRGLFMSSYGKWYRRKILWYIYPILIAFVLNLFRPPIHEKWNWLARILFSLFAIAVATDVCHQMAWWDREYRWYVWMSREYLPLNFSIAAVVFVFVWALVWDCRWASIITFWLLYLLGYAYSTVLSLRGSLFQLADLKNIATAVAVMDSYTLPLHPAQLHWAMVGVILIVLSRWIPARKPVHWAARAGKGVCVIVAAVWLMVMLHTPVLEMLGVQLTTWQKDAVALYPYQGTLATLMKDACDMGKNRPAHYAPEKLAEMYPELNQEGLIQQGTKRPHVYIIMNESLTDFESLYQLDTNEPAMPFIRSIQDRTIYGNVYVSSYGGATCNTEHSFLTASIPVPNQMTYLFHNSNENTPSFAWQLKAQGYTTYAIHPEAGTNYSRNRFYPLLGLDTFVEAESFENAERVHSFVSDQACYEKIVELFESRKSGEIQMVFNVTMQNHGGYHIGGVDKKVQLLGHEPDPDLEEYLNCVRHSDEAFQWLCSYFDQQQEPVVILLFGDHQPKMDMLAYEKRTELAPVAKQFTQQITPFVIWSNVPIETQYVEAISVNYLSSLLAETAGLSMTAYDRWLLNMATDYPVVFLHGYADATLDGHFWDRDERNWPTVLQQMNELRYNRIFDEKKRLPALEQTNMIE